ncbi:MAG: glycosyltransferase [Ignavibacteriaceae bacterium]|nr:glycosyltransferase [Ignavibacteriaceae bacterium]
MFKVLVIAYYFPPLGLSGVQRTLKFVKFMPNYNWQPTVITTGNIAYYAHDKSLLNELNSLNIRVIRTSSFDPNAVLSKFGTVKMPNEKIRKVLSLLNQAIFIPDNKRAWAKKAFEVASQVLTKEKFDVIFVSAPPFSSFKMAAELKKKFDIPLVFDYRDLWYKSYFAIYPTPFHSLIHKRMEYTSLKAADKVVVTNRKIKEKLINYFKFLTFDDVVIIPHGFDETDFKNIKVVPKTTDKMIITYSGVFLAYNTPKYFLKAFKQLTIERPDIASKIELHFVGYLRKENQNLIKELKLQEFVKDFGYMNHDEAVGKVMSSDILWLMIGRKRNIDAILPGKMFEYFGSGKPVIACVPEGAAKLAAADYGASFITEPENIEQIKGIILKTYDLYLNKRLPVPDKDFIEKHRRDYLTGILIKQFQLLIKEVVI